jgi:hypothetical protein
MNEQPRVMHPGMEGLDTGPKAAEGPTASLPHVKAPSVIVEGEPGSGKTWTLPTYCLDDGPDLFVQITEPNGLDALLDAVKHYAVPITKVHWHVTRPVSPGWASLEKMVQIVANFNYKEIQEIKSGVGKELQTQMMATLQNMKNFHCQRTGLYYGDVTTWKDDRAYAIDSLYGLNVIIMDQTIGMKPTAHQGEYGVAMNLQEKLLLNLTTDCQCYFTLNAHIDKVVDEVAGLVTSLAAIGNKNAPKIQKMFSEIVLQVKEGGTFRWSTAAFNVVTKNRALPISDKIVPSYQQIVLAHKRRKLEAAAGMEPPASAA